MPSYYRSDVPKRSPYRNLVAVVIILVVGAAIFWGVKTLWQIAHIESAKSNAEIERAVLTSGDVSGYDKIDYASPRSGDNISCVLLLTVDDVTLDQPDLIGARILAFNASDGTMANIVLPRDMWVNAEDGSAYTLAQLFGASGTAAVAGSRCVSRVAAVTRVKFGHALVLSDGAWDLVRDYSKGELPWAIEIGKLMELAVTDLDYDGIVEFLEDCHDYGLADTAVAEAPVVDYVSGSGTHWNWVQPEQLNVALGILDEAA